MLLARLVMICFAVLSVALMLPTEAHAEGYGEDGTYYTNADIEAAIHAAFDYEDWASAEAVAWCESTYIPTAYNPAYDTVGIFQISYIARVHYGLSYYDVDTPYENAAAAAMIQADEGWWPWACYSGY